MKNPPKPKLGPLGQRAAELLTFLHIAFYGVAYLHRDLLSAL
jgi:hypothetical protein